MKHIPFFIVPVVAGLFAGIICGRQVSGWFSGDPIASSPLREFPNKSSQGYSSGTSAAVSGDRHDLKSLLRWWLLEKSGGAENRAQLERMDATAIRNLMTDLAAAQLDSGSAEIHAMTAMLEAAAMELYQRDGEKSLQWADALDPASGRKEILTAMITAAVASTPDLAKPWHDRYLAEFGRNIAIMGAAIKGATARGAEDLVKLKEIYGSELQTGMPEGPLPEDFNFRFFMDHFSSGEPTSRTTMQHWAARNPDAAWEGVKEFSSTNGSEGSLYFGALFAGMAVGGNEKEAIRWLMPKLDELPEEFRRRALGSLFDDSWNTRAAVADIMAEMPREEDRIAVAEGLISPGYNGPAVLDALRALGSEDAQVKVLVRSAGSWSGDIKSPPDDQSRRILLYYSAIMDELQLSPESRGKFDARFRAGR